MNPDTQSEIAKLTEEMVKQNSLIRAFGRGLVYGIGFFIGSAIIATIIIGFLSPWIVQIDWVRDSFVRGVEILRESSTTN
jgi:hypothetical protein